jgi:hypothetical protein
MRRATGTVRVFTFKAGLLSPIAHDLQLRLPSFQIELDGETVRATFELASLVVDGATRPGASGVERLDAATRRRIEKAARDEVLRAGIAPQAVFSGTVRPSQGALSVTGELELVGHRASLGFQVEEDAGTFRASFDLQPSRWGIAPYAALLGAIRLQDRITIDVELRET